MVYVLVRVMVAFGGKPARDFHTFEKLIQMPSAPVPGLHLYFSNIFKGGFILVGLDEPGIESRLLYDTGAGRYVVENVDFHFEEAMEISNRLLGWGFEEKKS